MAEGTNALRIFSYNCFSIRKRIDPIRCLLKQCDILICQETILPSQFNSLLHSIDKDFNVLIRSSVTSDNFSRLDEGRPKGGMAVLFPLSSNINCDLIYSNDNFMVTRVTCGNVFLFFTTFTCPLMINLLKL